MFDLAHIAVFAHFEARMATDESLDIAVAVQSTRYYLATAGRQDRADYCASGLLSGRRYDMLRRKLWA